MKLYLVRHGEAKPKDVDPERPLTESGLRAIARIADFLRAADAVSVAEIQHSGKLRAKQTAELIAARLHLSAPINSVSNLDPLAAVSDLAEMLGSARTDLMLVGHLPHLNRLASRLVFGDEEREAFAFSEGGAMCLQRGPGDSEGGEQVPGWSVLWMVSPDLVP